MSYVIRTDHQPLIYLHHLRRFDDRLHRTLEDLNVGHYSFEYLPGRNDVAADVLSWMSYPWVLAEEEEYPLGKEVCQNLDEYEKVSVPGGGDSLFASLSLGLNGDLSQTRALRESAVETILKQPGKYGFAPGAAGTKKVKLLGQPDVFPPLTVLQAVSDTVGVQVTVLQTSGPGMTVTPAGQKLQEVCILCSGGVHLVC